MLGPNVFKISEFVRKSDIVKDFAQPPQRDAKTVWTAKATELTATFDVRFKVDKETWNPSGSEPLDELWVTRDQISKDRFMP